MFSLLQRECTIVSVNPRVERHGDETVPACDLFLGFTGSNDILSEFHPSLKSSLYSRPDEPDMADEPGYLPRLKFQHIGPVKWGQEHVGYRMVIHNEIDPRRDREVDLCDISKVVFKCHDGGSVETRLKVAMKAPEELVGWLCSHISSGVSVSLIPPSSGEIE